MTLHVSHPGQNPRSTWLSAVEACALEGSSLAVISSLSTVAGSHRSDVKVDEEAPYGDGAEEPRIQALIGAEKAVRQAAKKLQVSLTVVRVPLLVSEKQPLPYSLDMVLSQAASRSRRSLQRGGVHLGHRRDLDKALAALEALDERPEVVHLPGAVVSHLRLKTALEELGLTARWSVPRRRRWASDFRHHTALRRYWNAESMGQAAQLGHAPVGLHQLLVDVSQ